MIKRFNQYIKEQLESIVIKETSISKIFNVFDFYDEVYNYIKKELEDKKVTFTTIFVDVGIDQITRNREVYTNLTILVKEVSMDEKNYNIYVKDENGKKYIIPERSIFKWESIMKRNYTETDPYGEEDD